MGEESLTEALHRSHGYRRKVTETLCHLLMLCVAVRVCVSVCVTGVRVLVHNTLQAKE